MVAMAASGVNLRSILLLVLVAPGARAAAATAKRARFLDSPATAAPPEVLLRDDSKEVPRDAPGAVLPAALPAITASLNDRDAAAGDGRQLRLLGSATAAVSAVQQPAVEDPVRAFYRGLADPAAASDDIAQAQIPAEVQAPLPTLAPWGVSGTLPPAPMPLGVLPAGNIGLPPTKPPGTDVKAKMGELNTAVNNVLSELTQQLEQQQRFAMDSHDALEKEQAQVQTLTQENMQLGSQVAQLQASRVGMVEDAKSLSDDVQSRLATWISKYESGALGQAQGQAAAPPVQR